MHFIQQQNQTNKNKYNVYTGVDDILIIYVPKKDRVYWQWQWQWNELHCQVIRPPEGRSLLVHIHIKKGYREQSVYWGPIWRPCFLWFKLLLSPIITWVWCFFPGFDRFIPGFDRFIPGFDRFIPASIPVTGTLPPLQSKTYLAKNCIF